MKNDFKVLGELTEIYLHHNDARLMTIIETRDLELVQRFPNTWYAFNDHKSRGFYAVGNTSYVNGKRKIIRMHRWILGVDYKCHIDHINHNKLDNRRSNLRVVSAKENGQNRECAHRNSKSGIRGVSWHKKTRKWRVQVGIDYKKVHIGYFETLKEAEKAAVQARAKYMAYSKEARDLREH